MVVIDLKTKGNSVNKLIELIDSIPELNAEINIYDQLTFIKIWNANGWYGVWNNSLHISHSSYSEWHSVKIPIEEIQSISSL